ncbi:hypothetical protein [Thiomicrorhabdus xiamenensis]|uniref:Uncharacterized protein n=1 Tax=Thiomicrorhabdus xiamenensis TaxID=2739063 RepID=A0A7D4SZU6_9GAMM|nr:hypothetical protein [Thiomicrorhabdus xiamenensis]QKI88782.1 hypothetical protein HQN79_03970 [Thiomicrorhabdus xiamenensis]
MPDELNEINRLASISFQLIGGLIVLWSIDSNLGVIKNSSLIKMLTSYLKGFFELGKTQVIKVDFLQNESHFGKAQIRHTKKIESIEDKIDYIQEQLDFVENQSKELVEELRSDFQNELLVLKQEIRSCKKTLKLIDRNLSDISIGGIPQQVFGVFLVIYGSVISYFVT